MSSDEIDATKPIADQATRFIVLGTANGATHGF